MSPAALVELRDEVEAALVAALIAEPERVERLRPWFSSDWLHHEAHVWVVEALLNGIGLRTIAESCSAAERAYFRELRRCVVSDDVAHYGRLIEGLHRRLLKAHGLALLAAAREPAKVLRHAA